MVSDKIGVKFCNRQIDRQMDNSLTPYMGVFGFFLSVKFATSLLALITGGKMKNLKFGTKNSTIWWDGGQMLFYVMWLSC